MFSKRIITLASLIDKDAFVLDIGTDHAYLPIYLYQKNITKKIIASDISLNVLKYATNNLRKYNLDKRILLKQSDGFKNIKEKVDIAIIAGMGTTTIKNILKYPELPKTIIIQSNNELDKLRKYMLEKNYKIIKEIAINDKNKYYVIIKYQKGKDNLSEDEIEFGKNNNLDYMKYLLQKNEVIYKQSKDERYLNKIKRLKTIIEKIAEH
ncbi:MAG: SAM-dependent methyltransferase [Firmicutes bacterium]|nr:SAM-dependent methyltransferase [Bacillota bacterium]